MQKFKENYLDYQNKADQWSKIINCLNKENIINKKKISP